MGDNTTENTRCRKWLVTINNPIKKGWTRETLIDEINKLPKLVYWCMGDEIGENETYHTHIYFALEDQMRRKTLQNKFTGAHFDKPNGTSKQNQEYVFKSGEKFNKDENGNYEYIDAKGKLHKGTHYDETNVEWGELPTEQQGKRTDIQTLYQLIKDGMTNYEIMEYNPSYMLRMDKVEKARQTIREEKFRDVWREIEGTYIWGVSGAGKSRSIMDQYGYTNVYRVTDYIHPFDGYNGEDVIVFEEFRSSLKIDDMLKYLDGYPLSLPARFNNKVACYTKVYFATNIDIRDQYREIQREYPETWNAFLRRIQTIKVYNGESIAEYPLETYLKEGWHFFKKTPFDKEDENEAV